MSVSDSPRPLTEPPEPRGRITDVRSCPDCHGPIRVFDGVRTENCPQCELEPYRHLYVEALGERNEARRRIEELEAALAETLQTIREQDSAYVIQTSNTVVVAQRVLDGRST